MRAFFITSETSFWFVCILLLPIAIKRLLRSLKCGGDTSPHIHALEVEQNPQKKRRVVLHKQQTYLTSRFRVIGVNPTDKTASLPFSPVGGGVWRGAGQKIERKRFWSGGRMERTIWFRATTRSARAPVVKILRIFVKKSSDFVQKIPHYLALSPYNIQIMHVNIQKV